MIGKHLHSAVDGRLVDLLFDNDVDLLSEGRRAIESVLILRGGVDGIDVVAVGRQRGEGANNERKYSLHSGIGVLRLFIFDKFSENFDNFNAFDHSLDQWGNFRRAQGVGNWRRIVNFVGVKH